MTIDNAVKVSNNGLSYKQLIDLFNDCFLDLFNTRLENGYSEPIYYPALKSEPARVCFRADYASSALHEVAHWCIAGEKRREKVDYGYWYEPDGRSSDQQKEFEKVEVKPQALEWIFSIAAGIIFRISLDNLDGRSDGDNVGGFTSAVALQAQTYIEKGLPGRAMTFYQKLLAQGQGKCAELYDFSITALDR